MTAGWGETEVFMDVSSLRLARVLHRHLAEHGLLSFLSLLGAFRLHVIQRNQARAVLLVMPTVLLLLARKSLRLLRRRLRKRLLLLRTAGSVMLRRPRSGG